MAYNNKITVTSLTSPLATGVLKSTTGTGELTIAINSDLPVMTSTVGGAVPTPPNNTTTFLRGDGTFAAPSGGSGDITNGGNTTGAAITIGTNDAFDLNLETNAIPRLNITGGASTGGITTITSITANTSTVQDTLVVRTNSSGTAAAGFGGAILFQGESSTMDNQNMVRLSSIWTTATHASRTSALVYSDVSSAGAITERFRFSPSAMTTAVSYTLGNSANSITIGGGTGQVTVTSSNSTAGSIYIYNSLNTAAAVGAISVGGALSFTQTSATRNYMNFDYGFAPTSGTAIHNQLSFTGTINQTGGASGIVRGINLAHTMTAAADYRAIEIADNLATAKGIYQTGALTTNNFVGKTMFGSTAAPTSNLEVTASTSTGTDVGVKITGPAYTTTPTDNKVLQLTASYTRASGGGLVTMLGINPTVNFTSTTTAAMSAIDISPTLTAMTSGSRFYGIYINANNSSVRGIFQSGGSAMNIFEGKTAIGSTTDPTEALVVTGNTVTTGQQNAGDFQITDGAGFNVNWNNGNTQYVTIADNRTPTFSNPKNGARYLLRIIQGGGGSKLITWPTVTWRGGTAPTLTTTNGKQDLITLIYSNGVYYGDASLNY